MIPVSGNVRRLLLQAISSELEQLRIEAEIPQADKGTMTDEEYATQIKQLEVIRQDLDDGRLVIFDTRPQCSIPKCEADGRYEPTIFVFLKGDKVPCAQLGVQPIQHRCTQHADSHLGQYLTQPQWSDIQKQVMKQTQQVASFDDAKVMYMDHRTQNIVPPPNPIIAVVN